VWRRRRKWMGKGKGFHEGRRKDRSRKRNVKRDLLCDKRSLLYVKRNLKIGTGHA